MADTTFLQFHCYAHLFASHDLDITSEAHRCAVLYVWVLGSIMGLYTEFYVTVCS